MRTTARQNGRISTALEDSGAAELMTSEEIIAYLRLDAGGANARERLRNLIRRHSLPVLQRGRLQLFRRADVDRWLEAGRRSRL